MMRETETMNRQIAKAETARQNLKRPKLLNIPASNISTDQGLAMPVELSKQRKKQTNLELQ